MAIEKRILLIDDDAPTIASLTEHLTRAGYAADSAPDGLTGLERARRERPDLVIVNAILPRLNGFKVCRFLKFDENYKHIPLVMVSARAEEADRTLGMETGASAYLTKPINVQELLETIRIQLGLSSLT